MALAAITNYATLKTAIAEMAHKAGSSDVTGSTETLIALCEAELNDEMLLKDMESEETLTLTASQNYVALPSGYVSPIELWIVVSGQREKLVKQLPQELAYNTTNGLPEAYAIDGANIRFDCPVASDYTTAYFRMVKKSNLSGSVTSNALLLRRPDIYLYGSLKHLGVYMDDDRQLAKWSAMYERAKAGLKHADSKSRSRVPMRTDVPGTQRAYNINTDN